MQHHAAHRPARPLLALRRALGSGPDRSGPAQAKLRHRAAERVVVSLLHLLVERLDREVGALVAAEPEHPLDVLLRRPPRRRAAAPVDEPSLAVRLAALLPAPERANAHPQKLRRRLLRHLARVPAVQNRRKPHLAESLANPRRVHPEPSQGPQKNTSLHEPRTHVTPCARDTLEPPLAPRPGLFYICGLDVEVEGRDVAA